VPEAHRSRSASRQQGAGEAGSRGTRARPPSLLSPIALHGGRSRLSLDRPRRLDRRALARAPYRRRSDPLAPLRGESARGFLRASRRGRRFYRNRSL